MSNAREQYRENAVFDMHTDYSGVAREAFDLGWGACLDHLRLGTSHMPESVRAWLAHNETQMLA